MVRIRRAARLGSLAGALLAFAATSAAADDLALRSVGPLRLAVDTVTIRAGSLVVRGSAPNPGALVTIVGTAFQTKANAQEQFAFDVNYLPPTCRITLKSGAATLPVLVSNCGPTGPRGSKGPKGLAGPVGDRGATGPSGNPGAAGAQGPRGPRGPSGLKGPTGLKGPSGRPTFNGGRSLLASLDTSIPDCTASEVLRQPFAVTAPTRLFVSAQLRFLKASSTASQGLLEVTVQDSQSAILGYGKDQGPTGDEISAWAQLAVTGVMQSFDPRQGPSGAPLVLQPGSYDLVSTVTFNDSFGCEGSTSIGRVSQTYLSLQDAN